MVALAPNTSETSTWDVLDRFPKLHSRAREVKTARCTEAPAFKSLSRVEIWLTIYEGCAGLELFTRDPTGYRGGINLYEYVKSSPLWHSDPSGLTACTDRCGTLTALCFVAATAACNPIAACSARRHAQPIEQPARIEQFEPSTSQGEYSFRRKRPIVFGHPG